MRAMDDRTRQPARTRRAPARGATRAACGGIAVLAAKLAAWRLTGSTAVFSDALESIVNVVAGALLLYSLYLVVAAGGSQSSLRTRQGRVLLGRRRRHADRDRGGVDRHRGGAADDPRRGAAQPRPRPRARHGRDGGERGDRPAPDPRRPARAFARARGRRPPPAHRRRDERRGDHRSGAGVGHGSLDSRPDRRDDRGRCRSCGPAGSFRARRSVD